MDCGQSNPTNNAQDRNCQFLIFYSFRYFTGIFIQCLIVDEDILTDAYPTRQADTIFCVLFCIAGEMGANMNGNKNRHLRSLGDLIGISFSSYEVKYFLININIKTALLPLIYYCKEHFLMFLLEDYILLKALFCFHKQHRNENLIILWGLKSFWLSVEEQLSQTFACSLTSAEPRTNPAWRMCTAHVN